MYADGDVGGNSTNELARLTLRAGGQVLQADLNRDESSTDLLEALGVEPA